MFSPALRGTVLSWLLLGSVDLQSAAGQTPAEPHSLTYESDVVRVAAGWKNRIFLVVADGGPCRVPLDRVLEKPSTLYRKRRVGCAIYLSDRRFLLTTWSVVKGNSVVEIFNESGRHVVARIVGMDPVLDVALLEAHEDLPKTSDLAPLQVSEETGPGSECLVLGNAYGRSFSAVLGTIGESIEIVHAGLPVRVMRVNAAFFPGDSGGAVLDWEGKFVGMVTAISGTESGGAVSRGAGEIALDSNRDMDLAGVLGFAVPGPVLSHAWEDLREFGYVRRAHLGVTMSMGRQDEAGARIITVQPGSPAARAGIMGGDQIIGINGRPVGTPKQLAALVAASAPKTRIDIQFLRGRMERFATVELGEAPPPEHFLPPAIEDDPGPLPLSPTTPLPVTGPGRRSRN